MRTEASNFLFLKQHDMQLVRLGALAERYFHDDPNTSLIVNGGVKAGHRGGAKPGQFAAWT
ncbi:MAG: hypothetical protein WBE80_16420 [Methylocella sp.]